MSGLSFFNPAYLWALAFLAVPIIIHFLRRRQTVKLDFSSIRFLKNTAVQASRMRWLKNILLLLNRLLLIVLIVLLFAQPYNKQDPFRIISSSNTALYIWIDPTISMGYSRGEVSLWEEACAMASVFDTVLHAAAKLYCYDGRVDDFVSVPPAGMAGVITERITPLRHGPTDFEQMLAKFQEYKKKESRTPVLVMISDFQTKDKKNFEDFFSTTQQTYPNLCVSLAPDNPWNYALQKTRISFEDAPELTSSVKAYGRELSNGTVIALIQSMRAGQKTVKVKRNDSVAVSLDVSRHGPGSRGEVQLLVTDPYVYDNTSYFVNRRTEKKRILILSDNDASFVIEAALRSVAGEHWYPPRVLNPFEVTYDELDSSQVIILSSVREPTSILATLWSKSALSNKLIIFAPNAEENSGSLNALVFHYLDSKTPAKKVHTEKAFFPVLPDTVSALWRGFPRFTDKDVAVYTCFTPLPGKMLLRMNNGLPFVTHCIDSSGSAWIMFTTPIGITEANNLCETGFYVPVLDRLIRYGYESVKKEHITWIAGEPVRNPFAGTRLSAQVFDAGNRRVAAWDRQSRVVLETPGLYKIQPAGDPAYWVAAVADPSEGDCDYQLPDIADTNAKTIKLLNRSSFIPFIQNHRTPGFDFLWVLLALCVLGEILLWKRKLAINN